MEENDVRQGEKGWQEKDVDQGGDPSVLSESLKESEDPAQVSARELDEELIPDHYYHSLICIIESSH